MPHALVVAYLDFEDEDPAAPARATGLRDRPKAKKPFDNGFINMQKTH